MNRKKALFLLLLFAVTSLLLLPVRPASTKAVRPLERRALAVSPTAAWAPLTAPQQGTGDSSSAASPAAVTNYSLALNGVGAFVRVGDSPSLDIAGPITVEAWIKTNAISQQAIIERYRWLDAPDGGFALRLNDEGKLQFYTIQSNTLNDSLTGNTPLSAGVWHHVAGVFDGSQLRVYVDGALNGWKESFVAPGAGTADLKIGAEGAADAHFFDGLIDEARVTSGVRYAADFVPDRDLTSGGLVAGGVEDAGPRGIWSFGDQAAQDFSGKNNHGALVGGADFSEETAERERTVGPSEADPPGGLTVEAVLPTVINFDDVPTGIIINPGYHPNAVFSTDSANSIITWNRAGNACSSCPNVITRINNFTNQLNHFPDLFVNFPKPVDNLKFVIMGVDSTGTFARLDVIHQGGRRSENTVAGSGSPNRPVVVDIGGAGLRMVTSVHVYMDNLLFDENGISFDDFSFNLSPPPAAPTGLTGELTNLQISLRWNAVADATSYTVKRATSSGGPYTTLGTTTGTNFNDSSPLFGTTAFYVVTATSPAGTSANSAPFAILAGIPSPSDLTATPDEEAIVLRWTPADAGMSYRIRRRSTLEGWHVLASDILTTGFKDETAVPDEHYFYTVTAYLGSAESEESNMAEATLLPSCFLPTVPKPAPRHVAIPGSSWEMDASVTDHDGLVLENIKLKGRYMARMISVPYYTIRTNQMLEPQRGELTPVPGTGLVRAHLVHFSVTPRFKSNHGAEIDYITVTAMYDVDHITPTSKSCLFIEQSYDFYEAIPGDTCEPSGAFTCVRFYPFIKYSFIGRQGEKLESINFAQRHHYKPDGFDNQTSAVFRDCEVPGPGCITERVTGEGGNSVFSKLRNPISAEFESNVIRNGFDTGQWDNYHQTYNDRVSEPLEVPSHPLAGCPECVHMHWRWSSFTGNYITRPFGAVLPGVPIVNGNFFFQVHGKRQDLDIAVVRYRPGEEHPSAEQTYKSYVNNEPLRKSRLLLVTPAVPVIPGGPPGGPPGGLTDVSFPDGEVVFWYSPTGHEQQEWFFRHGAFFNPAVFKQARPVGTPQSSQGGGAALAAEQDVPVSVTFGRLFTEGSTTFTRIVPSDIAPPPPGYTPLASAAFHLDSDVAAAGPHEVTFKVASVTDQATFDKLRVFYAEPDPFDPDKLVWADHTILSPDTPAPDFANRTISARVGDLGYFMIAQLTQPQPGPAQANLSVNATDSADPVTAGNNLSYTLTVTNSGPQPTTGAGLVDYLSPDVEFISVTTSTGACKFQDGVVYCKLGTLAAGVGATVKINVKPFEAGTRFPAAGKLIDNSAFVGSYDTDTDLSNNRAVETTRALPNPNGPPTVTITSPATGARYAGPANVSVTASASDSDGTVSKVELYDNGELKATGAAQGGDQYAFVVNNLPFGLHVLSAVVTDNGGRTDSSAPVNVLVNGPGQVSILSPSEAAVLAPGSNPTLTARATVPAGSVDKVEFFANGTLVGIGTRGASDQFSFTWNDINRGEYLLTAAATDSAGITTFSVPVNFTVTQAPTVSVTSPADTTVFQSAVNLTLTAQAQDADGTIERVEFFANGELIGTDNAQFGNQYKLSWAPQDGIYSVTAVATDDLGVSTSSTPITIGVNTPSLSPGDFIWFDDAMPRGARPFGGRDDWYWVTSNPTAILGSKSHQSLIQDGFHQHGFDSASFKLPINAGDKLYTYVFLHPGYMPQEIMLEWRDGSGWDHRAFWSAQNVSVIRTRTTGDESSHWMGPLPTDSRWVRLEVPAEAVGLAGKVVDGMSFDLYGGRAAFDRSGKTSQAAPSQPAAQDTVWFEETYPGSVRFGVEKDKWEWVNPPVPFSGLAHRTFQAPTNDPDAATTYRAHWFSDASQPMTVNNGDILFTYAYVDPTFAPDQLVVAWGNSNGFRYAYWGESRRGVGDLGTETMRYMGPIPEIGSWMRLEVPASYLGLDGKTVNAMYFGMNRQLKRGLVYWDRAGKSTLPLSRPVEPLHLTTPVYRFLNETGYTYFVNAYQSTGPQPGPRWYAHNNQAPGTVPFYRYRFPTSPRQHFYTVQTPDSQGRLPSDLNWKLDTEFSSSGIAFYIYPKDRPAPPGTVPLRRYGNNAGRYFYTIHPDEQPPSGFAYQEDAGYVNQSYPVFSSMENPIDNTVFFVRQQYRDFLGREADLGGLNFWVGEINQCNDPSKRGANETLSACIERKRVDVSGAFFLSIEFKDTSYLIYRLYNAALNRPSGLLGFDELMADSARIGDGVVVLSPGWEAKLEANKVAFIEGFVARDEFLSLYPETMTPDQYVNALYAHASIALSAADRQTAVAEFAGASSSANRTARARVLRTLAESSALNAREINRAFVLMQYVGYLRRHPSDPPDNDLNGYDFWLKKLDQFNGDYRAAEMVKAFINSIEYRNRFGQPVTAKASSNIAAGSSSVKAGSISVIFSSAASSGTLDVKPVYPAYLATAPLGYAFYDNLCWAVTTASSVPGPLTVKVSLDGVFNDSAEFSNLRLLHLENGTWVDRTILPADFNGRTISASVTSLAPVVVARLSGDRPPSVSITSPAGGQGYTAPATVTINATAASNTAGVAKVEFLQGDTVLGAAAAAPYSFTWRDVPAGNYALTARATDSKGVSSTSPVVNVSVNDLPAVFIASPAQSAAFDYPAFISVTAYANDSNGVKQVEFFQGATSLGVDTAAPYSVTFNNPPVGTYTLTARATDNLNAVMTSPPITITVRNLPPGVSITSPADGAQLGNAPATVTVSATASDSNGIQQVEFFRDGVSLGADTTAPYSVTWSNAAAGSYSLTARATDTLNATTTSNPARVTVGNGPPSVSITSPAQGAYYNAPAGVVITAAASDNEGIKKVEFFQGATKLGEDLTAPYSFTWTGVAPGAYSLTARATDNLDALTTSAAVNVSVGGALYTLFSDDFNDNALDAAKWFVTEPASATTMAERNQRLEIVLATAFSAVAYNSYASVPLIDLTNAQVTIEVPQYGVSYGFETIFQLSNGAGGYLMFDAGGAGLNLQDSAAGSAGRTVISSYNTTQHRFWRFRHDPSTDKVLWETSSDGLSWITQRAVARPFALTSMQVSLVGGKYSGISPPPTTIIFDNLKVESTVPNTQPAVSITSPANGTVYTAPSSATITANASDSDGSVTRVEFLSGSTSLGVDTTAPYSVTLAVNNTASPGPYTLTARATDNRGGITTSAPVSVVVNNPPTVALTAPTGGASYTAPTTVALAASAADSDGTVASVEFFRDGVSLGIDTAAPYSVTWSNAGVGSYVLTAKATDNRGGVTTSSPVPINVTNVPPTISVTSPASGTSYNGPASITIQAAATDNEGVRQVEFFQGATSLGVDTTAPYSVTWSNVPAGAYSLTARATDNLGATATSGAVNVSVGGALYTLFSDDFNDNALDAAKWFVLTPGAITTVLEQNQRLELTPPNSSALTDYNGIASLATFDMTNAQVTVEMPQYAPGYGHDNFFQMIDPATNQSLTIDVGGGGLVLSDTATGQAGRTLINPYNGSQHRFWRIRHDPAADTLVWQTSPDGAAWATLRTTPRPFAITNLQLRLVVGHYSGVESPPGTTVFDNLKVESPNANALPTVSLTAPSSGAVFIAPASLTISANAADGDGTIRRVEFFSGQTSLGVATSAPYSLTWNNVAAGSYTLTARATDNRGAAVTSAAVSITVSTPNSAPTVSLTAPAAGSVYTTPAAVSLAAAAADSDGTVASVEFFRDGVSLGVDTTAPYSFYWTGVPAGSYSLTARATDNLGATTTSAAVTVTVNAQPSAPRADTVGVYTSNIFYLRNSNMPGAADITTTYGNPGWTPVVGDWDGNGTATLGVFNPNNGQGQPVFYLSNRTDYSYSDTTVVFGLPGDRPVAGDWDGNGTVTVGVYRPSESTFYLRNSNTTGPADLVIPFLTSGDTPLAGDWDGDGVDTIGIHNSGNATFYLRNSNTSGPPNLTVGFGSFGDKPVVGDWDGDGKTTVGSYQPSTSTFSVRNANTTGPADYVFQFGSANSLPVAGNWDGARAECCGDAVWFDDSLPAGAVTMTYNEAWSNITNNPVPFSGRWAHNSPAAAGEHGHYFNDATQTMSVAAGDKLFAYVYLDPANLPTEVMLQWSDTSWEHRAYWGTNNITWGVDGTNSRRYMGPLPQAGQWVRLEVPASLVGLEGATVKGISFNLAGGGGAAWDRAGKTTAAAPNILVSEFRFRGAAGSADEFVELYNNSDAPVTVCATDGSGGWSLVAADGLTRFTVPNGIVIPARGHYLATASAYGLAAYAAGDKSYTAEIADDAGVALFNTRNPWGFTSSNRFDAVGFSTLTNPLYFEGSGLATIGAAGGEYSFVRRFAGAYPQDTNNNAADFVFISNNGEFYGGSVASMLGSAGPENLLSPLLRNGPIAVVLLDPAASTAAVPNRERYLCGATPDCNPASAPAGTLVVRRKVINNTGVTLTGLRVRIMDFTTLNSPGYTNTAQADLRAISSGDSNITLTDGSTVLVKGTTLEQPPDQPVGGGYNSTLRVPLPAGGLPPGGAVNVQFVLGVHRSGTFRFLIITEALP